MRLVQIDKDLFLNPEFVDAVYIGINNEVMVSMRNKAYYGMGQYYDKGLREIIRKLQQCEENAPVAQ